MKKKSTFQAKFDELRAAKAEYQKKISEFGKAALKDRFKEFFDAHPEVRGVYWTQYTPYFNDGEPCEFSVNDFEPIISKKLAEGMALDSEDEVEVGDEECSRVPYGFEKKFPAVGHALDALQSDLGEIEDVMLDTFGDHVEVTATPKGFNINNYEHD